MLKKHKKTHGASHVDDDSGSDSDRTIYYQAAGGRQRPVVDEDSDSDSDKTLPFGVFDINDDECMREIAKEPRLRKIKGIRYVNIDYENELYEKRKQEEKEKASAKKTSSNNNNAATSSTKKKQETKTYEPPTTKQSTAKPETKTSKGDEDEESLQFITKKKTADDTSTVTSSSASSSSSVQKKDIPFIPVEDDSETVDALVMLETNTKKTDNEEVDKLVKLYGEDYFKRIQVIIYEQNRLSAFYSNEQLQERFRAYKRLQSEIEADLNLVQLPEFLFEINPSAIKHNLSLLLAMIQLDEALIQITDT